MIDWMVGNRAMRDTSRWQTPIHGSSCTQNNADEWYCADDKDLGLSCVKVNRLLYYHHQSNVLYVI